MYDEIQKYLKRQAREEDIRNFNLLRWGEITLEECRDRFVKSNQIPVEIPTEIFDDWLKSIGWMNDTPKSNEKKGEKIYGIFKDGDCIFKGNKFEVAEKFKIGVYSIYDYVYPKKKKLLRKYIVRRLDRDGNIEKEVKKSKKQRDIEYIVDRFTDPINYTHNTSTEFDPTPYFPDLYDMGYDCRIAGIFSNTDGKIVTKSHRNSDVHYLIEYVERV